MKKEIKALLYFSALASLCSGLVGCQTSRPSPRADVLNRSADILSRKAEGQSYVLYRETEQGQETYVHNQYMTKNNRPVTEHLVERPDGSYTFTRETNANMQGEMDLYKALPKMRRVPVFTERALWEMRQAHTKQ